MTEPKIIKHNIRDQIADLLRAEIWSGGFKESESIREEPLAKRFGVSRGPIRDALLQLSKEGLLEAIPNRGVRVSTYPSGETRKLMVKLRRELECHALREIIDHLTKDDLNAWKTHLKEYLKVCKAGHLAPVVQVDMAFHRSIVSHPMVDNLDTVWLPVITQLTLPYSRHEDLMESFREHEGIIQAAVCGDRKQALASLKAHIQ